MDIDEVTAKAYAKNGIPSLGIKNAGGDVFKAVENWKKRTGLKFTLENAVSTHVDASFPENLGMGTTYDMDRVSFALKNKGAIFDLEVPKRLIKNINEVQNKYLLEAITIYSEINRLSLIN